MNAKVGTLIFRGIFTTMLISGLGACIYLLAMFEIPHNNKEHVWTLLGVLSTLTTTTVLWWYSSSKGSSDKTEILATDLQSKSP